MRFEIVDALKPDQRNRDAGTRLDRRSASSASPRCISSVRGVCPSIRSIRHRSISSDESTSGSWSASTCCTARSACSRARAGSPGTPIRTSRAEIRALSAGSLARQLERLFEMTDRQPDRTVVPLDLRQQLKTLRLQRGRHVTGRRSSASRRASATSPVSQQRGRMTERPPHEGLVAVGRREPAAAAEQLRRGVERATQAACRACVYDLGRPSTRRLATALREVAGPLLRIGHDLREATVECASMGVGDRSIHRGCEQWMRKPDPAMLGNKDARVLSLEHRSSASLSLATRQRSSSIVGRDSAAATSTASRAASDSAAIRSAASFWTLRGTGSGRCPPDSLAPARQGPRDLDREERVAARRLARCARSSGASGAPASRPLRM